MPTGYMLRHAKYQYIKKDEVFKQKTNLQKTALDYRE